MHDYARVKLNGKDFAAHAWQPYRWDITGALKAGSNDLEIEVRASPVSRGFAGRGNTERAVSGLLGPVRIRAIPAP